MTFCIVTVGWNCADFYQATLASIDAQTYTDYRVVVIDDASDDPRMDELHDAMIGRDWRWGWRCNPEQVGSVRNQHDAIEILAPDDDDVVVWLDLDGDRFAHPYVLEHLAEVYSDPNVWLTYGSYRPVPDPGDCPPVLRFPADVIAAGSYRQHILRHGSHFNHLRTMRGRVATAIPEDQFKWPGTDRWYRAGADYIYMACGLELAGPRHRKLDEILCLYNHANPRADNLTHPDETSRCVISFLERPPLTRL